MTGRRQSSIRKRGHDTRSNSLYIFIVLLMLFGLIGVTIALLKNNNKNKISNLSSRWVKHFCPLILNRSRWSASTAKYNDTEFETPVPHFAIHHTAGRNCVTVESCIVQVQNIQTYHMKNLSWTDIGYNFLVGGNGYIFEGRGWNQSGSHCLKFNNKSIGMSILKIKRTQYFYFFSQALHSLVI